MAEPETLSLGPEPSKAKSHAPSLGLEPSSVKPQAQLLEPEPSKVKPMPRTSATVAKDGMLIT